MKLCIIFLIICSNALAQNNTTAIPENFNKEEPVTASDLLLALELAYKHLIDYDVTMFQPVYISPAERLRREADRIEQKEKDLAFIQRIRVRLAIYGIFKE